MCMRGLGYAPSTISSHWLNSGISPEFIRSPPPWLQSIQIMPFYETCYLLTCINCTELIHSTFQCARDDLLWGTVKI